MAEGLLPIVNPNRMNEEMMDTYSDVSNLPLWNQWWAAGKTAFSSPPQVPAAEIPYAQDELKLQDFVPNCAISYSTVQYGSIPAQHYPSPTSQSCRSNSPVSPGSTSSHLELRKRKRNTTEYPTAKSSGRCSSKNETKPKSKETGKTSKTHRKSQKTESALITPSPEEETDGYTCRDKERNRVASNKLRAKKRENAKKLKSEAEDMERINRHLSSCVADLTLEVYDLKTRLLQHTDCDCSRIQKYIVDEAHRYISRLGAGSATSFAALDLVEGKPGSI
ncbi:uncharacterized protein B0J16DRAFT_351571 [Fusarium flagelliforme]|uniref:BZIP domain-containing protein n=1 Tax=Fusarium flagelliforme TaxID=2675880 RepID=A0A395MH62_9HYPO|nr:uncharacterized protein B0J16DRAFT_351571 [Fusarium flagelliforme]KAH7169801.1 hypothetical protein B0J16DRAFT_351571 [Fusarium flagelliforme]RFN47268.1 hypothetical protein FIE12Z_8481 [Fusarium flagelliforme]